MLVEHVLESLLALSLPSIRGVLQGNLRLRRSVSSAMAQHPGPAEVYADFCGSSTPLLPSPSFLMTAPLRTALQVFEQPSLLLDVLFELLDHLA